MDSRRSICDSHKTSDYIFKFDFDQNESNNKQQRMDIQRFHRCLYCDRGQLMAPDLFCLTCQPDSRTTCQSLFAERNSDPRFIILERAELDLENGIINEGQYLEICDNLKN